MRLVVGFVCPMILDMRPTGPMTAHAGNAENKIGPIVAAVLISIRCEIRCVAVKTPFSDTSREVGRAVTIFTRTVDPAAGFREIADRQLAELVAVPIEIRLPVIPGAGHDVKPLAMFVLSPVAPDDDTLKQAVFTRRHLKENIGILRLQTVLADREVAQHRIERGGAGGPEMRRLLEALGLVGVAFAANMSLHEAPEKRVQTGREFWTLMRFGEMHPACPWRCPIGVKVEVLFIRRIVNTTRQTGDWLALRIGAKQKNDQNAAQNHGREKEAENGSTAHRRQGISLGWHDAS